MRCTALIDAGPGAPPHRYLEEKGYLPAGVIHRCMRCASSWTLGASGWARAGVQIEALGAQVSPTKTA